MTGVGTGVVRIKNVVGKVYAVWMVVVPLPRKLFLYPFVFIELTTSNFHCRDLYSLYNPSFYIRFLVCPIIIIIIIIVRVYTNFSLDRDGQSSPRRFEKRTANLSTSFGKRFPAGEGEAHYSKEVAVGGHSNHRSFPRPSIETFESRLGRKEERKKAGNETSRLVSKKSDDN